MYTASLTLVRVATLKYVDILRAATRSTGPGSSPVLGASPQNAIFVLSFVGASAFFIVNVLVAFIVDGFNLNRGSSAADVV